LTDTPEETVEAEQLRGMQEDPFATVRNQLLEEL